MHVVDLVIFAGWVAFWVYWLAASMGVKSGQTDGPVRRRRSLSSSLFFCRCG